MCRSSEGVMRGLLAILEGSILTLGSRSGVLGAVMLLGLANVFLKPFRI